MNENPSWDDVRRVVDELEVKIHLAGMEARDRWRALQPRLLDLQHQLERSGKRASDTIDRELSSLGAALRRLRDDLATPER